jgi:hypothetical protein
VCVNGIIEGVKFKNLLSGIEDIEGIEGIDICPCLRLSDLIIIDLLINIYNILYIFFGYGKQNICLTCG